MSYPKHSTHELIVGKSDQQMQPKRACTIYHSGFVAGGFGNLLSGVESEARRIIEEKYADEWNASGLLHRWRLQRKMDREIAELVAETMPEVSP
jgi:hypothetical protein